MDLQSQGSPWTDENCADQEKSADELTAHEETIATDK